MATEAEAISTPGILIVPIFTPSSDEWKRIMYTFLNTQKAIEDKVNICCVTRVIDVNQIQTQGEQDAENVPE